MKAEFIDAVDFHADCARWARAHKAEFLGLDSDDSPIPSDQVGEAAASLLPILRGDTFFVGAEVCRLLEHSTRSFPGVTLTESLLPSQTGFVRLASPLIVPDSVDGMIDVEAIGWAVSARGAVFSIYECRRPVITRLCGLEPRWREGFAGPQWAYEVVDGNDDNDVEKAMVARVASYIAALLTFMAGRLLQRDAVRMERAVQRRIHRAGLPAEELQVIRLRRSLAAGSADVGGRGVDWSCRWIVRGHWRQQWRVSQCAHVPVWIRPHVKGPENRPLRQPEKMFAVVR